MKLLDYLNGYKTYILVLAGAGLWVGTILDWWSPSDIQELLGLLGTLGVGTVAHKIDKASK